jgi:hypothetical protein
MPARDDAGSNYGRPGGSQNSGVNNGGVAGGMGGGFGGGGAGRMGGINSSTGLTTGNRMYGGMAMGRPGGMAMNPGAFGYRPQAGIAQGPLSGARPRPAAVAGVNPLPENIPALEDVPMPPATPNVFNQDYLGAILNFRNMINGRYGWNDQPVTQGPGPVAPRGPIGSWPGQGVSPMARNPKELSNYNWSGTPRNITGAEGGLGIQTWDRNSGAAPSNRGYGGWNTPGFN